MYCVFSRFAVAGLAASACLWAPDGAPFATGARAAQVALTVPPPQTQAVASSFADRLEQRIVAEAAATKDARQKAWLAQIRSFYLARQGAPIWVSASGWTARANAAILELASADNWGLSAKDFAVPDVHPGAASEPELADAELGLSRAIVKYAFHARGGRIEPSSLSLWLDRTPDDVYATAVLIDIISNEDAGAAMRAMHPRSESFEALRQTYLAMRREIQNPKTLDPADIVPPGPELKIGDWNPGVEVIRRRLRVPALAGNEARFDEALAEALENVLAEQRVKARWGRIDDRVRAVLNRPPPPPARADLMRILANMERWRWLPRDLGATHIWNNLPEFVTRFVKDGTVIHEERIIVGQPETQTPVFSDMMRAVVFQPEWGVPPSIKINDLLPKLQSGDFDVLERRNMRILGISGRELNPERFDWDKVDIRDVGIYQRSGDGNPLGRVKFLFPNKFQVYMHDTNAPALFKQKERTFSHGCIRVRNPEKFAEILLGADQGWSPARVEKELDDWEKPNNKFELKTPIPVHNVYFTLVAGAGGMLTKFEDIYGHDQRVIQALSGVPAETIAADDPARNQQEQLEEAAPAAVKKYNASKAALREDEAR